MTERGRHLYIDNLRLTMIILVVMVHLAVTYSGIGGWYHYELAELRAESLLVFAFFLSFTQAYFMGFLFLLAGYFVPNAYDRKGFLNFIKGRFLRLGIPTLIYMFVIEPFTIFIKCDKVRSAFMDYYLDYISTSKLISGSGPLWFALALLIFSIIYAFIRVVMDKIKSNKVKSLHKRIPNAKHILLLIVFISTGSFLIRLIQPIDTSILNMQLCFFTQYIVLFIIGIKSYRNNWFNKTRYSLGIKWLKLGIVLGFVVWIIILATGGGLRGEFDIFKGGLHWQSLAYAIWESFVSVAIAIGLIVLFRERFNYQSKLIKTLSDNAFGVYVFHAPILVFITSVLAFISIPPLLKFVLMSLICIPICFLVAYILRRIPLLNRVI